MFFRISKRKLNRKYKTKLALQYTILNCSENDCLPDCPGICVLTVEAEDQGEPKLTGRTLIYVHITDINLNDPEINFR